MKTEGLSASKKCRWGSEWTALLIPTTEVPLSKASNPSKKKKKKNSVQCSRCVFTVCVCTWMGEM